MSKSASTKAHSEESGIPASSTKTQMRKSATTATTKLMPPSSELAFVAQVHQLRPVPKPEPQKHSKRLAKKRGKDSETRIASRLGGRKVMFSGAGVLEKGDVVVDRARPVPFVEVKYSGEIRAKDGAHTYSLAYETVEKTVLDAKTAGRVPVISLVFGGREHVLYLTTSEYFEELVAQSIRLQELQAFVDSLPSGMLPDVHGN